MDRRSFLKLLGLPVVAPVLGWFGWKARLCPHEFRNWDYACFICGDTMYDIVERGEGRIVGAPKWTFRPDSAEAAHYKILIGMPRS